MKKLVIATVLSLATVAAFATDITSGGAITPTQCAALNTGASVKITLSTSNLGAYDCQAAGAAIGVAVGNTAGKGFIYSVGSGGGAVTTSAAGTTVNSANLGTAATARKTEAASS